MRPESWERKLVDMPRGRLHAVAGAGLISGRAVCGAPVTLLDPRDWRWPEDVYEATTLCPQCLALTL
jgi:hypothetical protein